MKILIVDDSNTDRTILTRVLQKAFSEIEVIPAEDGRVGLDILNKQSQEIGLILLDWEMPKVDGLEFMRLIRKQPALASIPVIMVSSAWAEEQREIVWLINPNLAGYFIKPVQPEALIEKVKTYIK
ncbi:MAG: response regulator [Candidatus Omnitrophica bacterium]|nr:response regulator [Candidatus Omnitrophota bacterium]